MRGERENVLSAFAEQRCIIWSVCGQRGDGGVAGTRDKILNSDYSAEEIGTNMKYAKTNFRPSNHDLQAQPQTSLDGVQKTGPQL